MKKYLIVGLAFLLAGCATPSRVIEKFNKGELVERITEYDNSTFHSGKKIGLTIGINPQTRTPEVVLLYGRYESARIKNGMFYDSKYSLNNVSLLTGEGTAEHIIRVGPKELYVKPPEK